MCVKLKCDDLKMGIFYMIMNFRSGLPLWFLTGAQKKKKKSPKKVRTFFNQKLSNEIQVSLSDPYNLTFNQLANKHNAELQRTDPGTKVTGEFSTRGHIFSPNVWN